MAAVRQIREVLVPLPARGANATPATADHIQLGEVAKVENIGLRTTRLYEYDHHHNIIVPNNQLATRRITNYSAPDSYFKADIFVGASYGADPAQVTRGLLDVARASPD